MENLIRSTPLISTLNMTWTPKAVDENRGFKSCKIRGRTVTAGEQSNKVEFLLELMASYMPHIPAQVIIYEAKSFNWIYSFLLQQYGHRTSIEVRSVKTMQTDPKPPTKEPKKRPTTNPGKDLAARAEGNPGTKAPNEDQEECGETKDKVSIAQSDNDSAITVSSKSIGEIADPNVARRIDQNEQTSAETEL